MGTRIDGINFFVVVFFRLTFSLSTVSSSCQVEVCSREYARATASEHITRGPSYQYCTVLRSYSECIRATARSCRGNLEYHSILSLVMQWSNDFNCSYIIAHGRPEYPPFYNGRVKPRPTFATQCTYKGRFQNNIVYSHCGLFGDPHLRTFHNEFQTCRVLGAWPLIDNSYLAVQVTNSAVVKDGAATATSKVTIIIREHSPCTPEKTYVAQTDFLPSVFVDGTKSSGPDKNVRIKEEVPGRHVEIYIRHISTRIVLHQIGHYLTFAIRIPQEVAIQNGRSDSFELCAKGCPKQERIDYSRLFSLPNQWIPIVTKNGKATITVQQAAKMCREFNVTDFYFDACIFDLLTTGDSSFSQAARQAMKDVIALYPSSVGMPNNQSFFLSGRINLDERGILINKSSQTAFSIILTAILILLFLCLNN
ncbi:repulsive guidance molecule A-like [Centruroides sculpturatus]|uniref:repulsive guidance molecule A-like n=1 Tax=Centruroides sculpturatus TaxID=218467 RepID=UPI000C6EC6D7|nr:repulsive guidance molecule A-like [Centruroides sculpturatus]